jgi:hypothetical protein
MTSLRRGALAIKYVLRSLSKTLSTHEHVRKEVVFNRTTVRNKLQCFISLIFNRKFFQKNYFRVSLNQNFIITSSFGNLSQQIDI